MIKPTLNELTDAAAEVIVDIEARTQLGPEKLAILAIGLSACVAEIVHAPDFIWAQMPNVPLTTILATLVLHNVFGMSIEDMQRMKQEVDAQDNVPSLDQFLRDSGFHA